jgi:hypothetical protein
MTKIEQFKKLIEKAKEGSGWHGAELMEWKQGDQDARYENFFLITQGLAP